MFKFRFVALFSLSLTLISWSHTPAQSITPSPSATPVVKVRYAYYAITGNTARELRSQMSRKGPSDRITGERYDANTDWFVRWSYRYASKNNQCAITSVSSTVDIVFTMPQWQSAKTAGRSLRNEWQQYIRALQLHEDGHKNNGIAASKDIIRTLRTLPAYSSCQMLEAAANTTAHKTVKRYNQKDIEYDDVTRHGYTQGAVFPTTAISSR